MASTSTSPVTTTTTAFMRRRSSAASLADADADGSKVLDSLTAFFLPEAAAVVSETVPTDLTESLLAFDVDEAQQDEDEYNLPVSILPMSPTPSPRARSASALSTAALESATAAISSWFTYEDFEGDADALEDEYASEPDDDFLMDDYEQPKRGTLEPEREQEPEPEPMPTPAKLSLIAEEEYAPSVASPQAWSVKSLGWPWARAN